jgi:hypothetical protein
MIDEIEQRVKMLPLSADFGGKPPSGLILFAMSGQSGKRKLITPALCAISADPKQSP